MAQHLALKLPTELPERLPLAAAAGSAGWQCVILTSGKLPRFINQAYESIKGLVRIDQQLYTSRSMRR